MFATRKTPDKNSSKPYTKVWNPFLKKMVFKKNTPGAPTKKTNTYKKPWTAAPIPSPREVTQATVVPQTSTTETTRAATTNELILLQLQHIKEEMHELGMTQLEILHQLPNRPTPQQLEELLSSGQVTPQPPQQLQPQPQPQQQQLHPAQFTQLLQQKKMAPIDLNNPLLWR